MKKILRFAALSWALGIAAQDAPLVREMNVTQGPESVFDRAPSDILPALADAKATGENGRVGRELVFWGFEHADGRRVFLFACAQRPDVDCTTRVSAICPVTTTVIETREASGNTVRRTCRNVAVVSPGEVRPGCVDRAESTSMAVGLVTCG